MVRATPRRGKGRLDRSLLASPANPGLRDVFHAGPEENHAALYEHLLRRNAKLFGAFFAIGEEDAIYLRGQLDHDLIGAAELDRVLGSLYQWVEQYFRPALRIGFASKFA